MKARVPPLNVALIRQAQLNNDSTGPFPQGITTNSSVNRSSVDGQNSKRNKDPLANDKKDKVKKIEVINSASGAYRQFVMDNKLKKKIQDHLATTRTHKNGPVKNI